MPPWPADPVRLAAYEVLSAVSGRGAYANLLLPAALRDAGLTGRDAALATELVYGTLRGRGTYDAIIGLCADRDLDRIDPPVREVLRVGAHQLLGTRIKPHAAVATTVDLAAAVAGRRRAGFVNAVLRRVGTRDLESWIEIAAPSRAADPVGHLSVRYSHPRWIVSAFADAFGDESLAETEAALAADRTRPAVTLAAVPGRGNVAELVAAGAVAARWSPYGAYLPSGDPAGLATVRAGRAAVQDEASQLAAVALTKAELAPDAGPGQRWLDLCAGPGGKARLLAGLAADSGAVLVCADAREHRAQLAAHAIAGRGEAAVVTADGTAPAWRAAAFDRVLADVPCSGLGSLRRRPDARWRRSPADVTALAALQRRLLEAAVESARPGGVIAYVTCSPHAAETTAVVGAVLADRTDVDVLDAPLVLGGVPGLRCPAPNDRFAQFWPHRHGTDAIFIALLRRAAAHQ